MSYPEKIFFVEKADPLKCSYCGSADIYIRCFLYLNEIRTTIHCITYGKIESIISQTYYVKEVKNERHNAVRSTSNATQIMG